MNTEKLVTQKEELLLKKLRLQSKEKILNEKTRKIKIKRLIELGDIIMKSEIDHLEIAALYGAFSEIKEAASNPETLKKWSLKGKKVLEHDHKLSQQQMIISFQDGASDESKKILRENQFKWYAFRNEWYGRGKKELLEDLLKNQGAKIEVVS